MGNHHSKPEDRLRYISREVNSLRSSLRQSRQNLSRSKKEAIVESLANQSGEVSAMHGKVRQKKIEETLKNISATMEEVLQIEPRDLDLAAVESDSFVHMPVRRRSDSFGSQKINIKRPQQKPVNRSSVPTIREIEAKVEDLRPHIITAFDNRDTKQLRVHKTTIELLAGDLEMIHVESDTPIEKRKENLMKKLTQQYQKITKILRDIKREDNIQYLSTQNLKEKAINDLADIELHLAENESLLDRLTKEKNMSNMAAIRNNIMQISQRLSKINLVDNEVKDKVLGLSQKLSEIIRNLDRTLARKEFDSKFAQLSETLERINRNFNEATNAESTKNTLEHLRSSVENLEELNDSTKKRKKELLSKIDNQLSIIDNKFRNEADSKVVQEIVEDNVIFRKKVRSSDKDYTVIDQFINYWNNVKTNFDLNLYSHLSLLRIDSVLEEMQHSINEIRIGIANKCDTNPPSNLTRKHSHSIPRLNTKKRFGSNQSLNQFESKIIKAKAKMYNISTPELMNVQQQEDSYVNSRFSKIEEIKMHVHYIKEKVDQSHNKNILRDKLENYLKILAECCKDSNKTIANNAVIVSNEITELLHTLVIAELKEQSGSAIRRAQNFNGTRYDKDFDDIKGSLVKLQAAVENFNIPDRFESLQNEKDRLLDDIYYGIESLQEKTSFYRKQEDESVKKIKDKLQSLNERVRRFSGTYKGVLYNQIERDLNKLLLQIGEQIEDRHSLDETTKETEKLLKILEQRATLAQSFKAGSKSELSKHDDQAGMNKIKSDLYNIKKEIDKTPDENVEAFIGLQSRLDLVNLELSQISTKSNENLEKEKDIFSNEAQTLRNVVDAKVALGQQPIVQWPEREMQHDLNSYPKNDVNKEMEKLESKFQKIKSEVNAPDTGEDIHKFYKLAQDIKKLLEKLEQYKFIKDTDLFFRKTNLFNEMQYYLESLEKEAKDADYVISIEQKLDSLENMLDSNQQSDLNTMAKELQEIQSKLENHKVSVGNELLRERKTSVQQKTEDLTIKLKQKANDDKESKDIKLRADIKKITDIEDKVKALRSEIHNFVGLQSDRKFYELDETAMRLSFTLDKMVFENADLQKRKNRLLKELHQFGQILDERAHQFHEIIDVEQDFEDISSLMDKFSGKEEELSKIKSELEQIAKKAQSLRATKELIPRKNACMEKLSILFNRMMGLNVNTSFAASLQNDQRTNQFRSTQNYSHSSMATSSSRIRVIEHTATGYSTQIYNISDKNDDKMIQASDSSNEDKLNQIEKEISEIELLVQDTNDESKLQETDDRLTEYTIQLNALHYPKDSAEHKKKVMLYGKVEHITELIDKKLADSQSMAKIEHEVDEIGKKLNTPLTAEQIDSIDERLINLQISLGKLSDTSLKHQVDACMMKIILYSKNISDYKLSIKTTSV